MDILGTILIVAGIGGCMIFFPRSNFVTPELFLSAAASILGALMRIAGDISIIRQKVIELPQKPTAQTEVKDLEE